MGVRRSLVFGSALRSSAPPCPPSSVRPLQKSSIQQSSGALRCLFPHLDICGVLQTRRRRGGRAESWGCTSHLTSRCVKPAQHRTRPSQSILSTVRMRTQPCYHTQPGRTLEGTGEANPPTRRSYYVVLRRSCFSVRAQVPGRTKRVHACLQDVPFLKTLQNVHANTMPLSIHSAWHMILLSTPRGHHAVQCTSSAPRPEATTRFPTLIRHSAS